MKHTLKFLVATSVVAGSFLFGGSAMAAAPQPGTMNPGMGRMERAPGVMGTVTAINGSTLTITGKGPGMSGTATTYTIDASNAKVDKDGAASTLASVVVGDTIMAEGTVSGTSVTATVIRDGKMPGRPGMGMDRKPGIMGTVASISGSTLTVTSKMGPKENGTATTYTVDASSATVTKAGASSSVSGIAVGDTVMVEGTINGTSIAAKAIRDGVPEPKAPLIEGDGQPVVGGTVIAVSGSTLTIKNKSNVTYSVDASSAKVSKAGALSTIANVAVGDSVVVQGAVNGTSITASSVSDEGAPKTGGAPGAGQPGPGKGFGGFLHGIGGFFQHFFGFF